MQAEAGMDFSVPTGVVGTAIDIGKTLAKAAEERELDMAEQDKLFDAGIGIALNPPGISKHVTVAYSVLSHWELALRYNEGAFRGATRLQFLNQERNGVDFSAGIGLQRMVQDIPTSDIIGLLDVEDFTRWTIDVPLLFGRRGDFYRLWGGPRLAYTRVAGGISLSTPALGSTPAMTIEASTRGSGTFIGAQGGVALGYRWLFVGAELTVVRLFSTAHYTFVDRTRDVDLGGVIIYPGLAIMGEF